MVVGMVVGDDLALRAVRGWGYRRVHQLLLDEGWELNGCASPSRSWPCHILAVRFGLSQPDGVRGAPPIPPSGSAASGLRRSSAVVLRQFWVAAAEPAPAILLRPAQPSSDMPSGYAARYRGGGPRPQPSRPLPSSYARRH